MKIVLLLHVVATIIFIGCGFTGTDSVQKKVPGVYARFSSHEYGSEYDTLIISLMNKVSDQYQIIRKWKYERFLDGKLVEPEYKQVTTSGFYNSRRRFIRDNETGEIYSFDIRNKILFNGPVKYQKL